MERNYLLSKDLYFILAVWVLYLALVIRAVRTWHFAQKILSEVLQRIVTLGYMPGVLHLFRGPWRRLVKRTPWTLDKVWGCQKRKLVTNFQKESQILSPIRGSVKATHMRRFIRADDAWEPFGGVSQGISRVHHYYLVETGPGQPWLQN